MSTAVGAWAHTAREGRRRARLCPLARFVAPVVACLGAKSSLFATRSRVPDCAPWAFIVGIPRRAERAIVRSAPFLSSACGHGTSTDALVGTYMCCDAGAYRAQHNGPLFQAS